MRLFDEIPSEGVYPVVVHESPKLNLRRSPPSANSDRQSALRLCDPDFDAHCLDLREVESGNLGGGEGEGDEKDGGEGGGSSSAGRGVHGRQVEVGVGEGGGGSVEEVMRSRGK